MFGGNNWTTNPNNPSGTINPTGTTGTGNNKSINSVFGNPTGNPGTFGAFGSSNNPVFGMNPTNAPTTALPNPTTGTGTIFGFGGTNPTTTGGFKTLGNTGLYNAPTNVYGVADQPTTGIFGGTTYGTSSTGTTTTTAGGIFGNQPRTGLGMVTTTGFGSAPMGSTTGTGIFGTGGASAFGGHKTTTTTTGGFGTGFCAHPQTSTTGAFGNPSFATTSNFLSNLLAQSMNVQTGTLAYPYQITKYNEANAKGQFETVNIMSITLMDSYRNKSLEQLRYEDYLNKKKGINPGKLSINKVMMNQQPTGMMQNVTFGGNVFGQPSTGTTSAFGGFNTATTTNPQSNFTFGQPSTTTGGFTGFGSGPSSTTAPMGTSPMFTGGYQTQFGTQFNSPSVLNPAPISHTPTSFGMTGGTTGMTGMTGGTTGMTGMSNQTPTFGRTTHTGFGSGTTGTALFNKPTTGFGSQPTIGGTNTGFSSGGMISTGMGTTAFGTGGTMQPTTGIGSATTGPTGAWTGTFGPGGFGNVGGTTGATGTGMFGTTTTGTTATTGTGLFGPSTTTAGTTTGSTGLFGPTSTQPSGTGFFNKPTATTSTSGLFQGITGSTGPSTGFLGTTGQTTTTPSISSTGLFGAKITSTPTTTTGLFPSTSTSTTTPPGGYFSKTGLSTGLFTGTTTTGFKPTTSASNLQFTGATPQATTTTPSVNTNQLFGTTGSLLTPTQTTSSTQVQYHTQMIPGVNPLTQYPYPTSGFPMQPTQETKSLEEIRKELNERLNDIENLLKRKPETVSKDGDEYSSSVKYRYHKDENEGLSHAYKEESPMLKFKRFGHDKEKKEYKDYKLNIVPLHQTSLRTSSVDKASELLNRAKSPLMSEADKKSHSLSNARSIETGILNKLQDHFEQNFSLDTPSNANLPKKPTKVFITITVVVYYPHKNSFDLKLSKDLPFGQLKSFIVDELKSKFYSKFKNLSSTNIMLMKRYTIMDHPNEATIESTSLRDGDSIDVVFIGIDLREKNTEKKKQRKNDEICSFAPTEELPIIKEFKTIPDYTQISRLSLEELENVDDFTVYNEFGKIVFQGKTNLRKLDVDKIVKLSNMSVSLYEDVPSNQVPKRGSGLNKPCIITLFKCFPKDESYNSFVSNLRSICEANKWKFLSYDGETGEFSFKAEHFNTNV